MCDLQLVEHNIMTKINKKFNEPCLCRGKDYINFLHSSLVFLTIDADFSYLSVKYKWIKSSGSNSDEQVLYQPSQLASVLKQNFSSFQFKKGSKQEMTSYICILPELGKDKQRKKRINFVFSYEKQESEKASRDYFVHPKAIWTK